MQLHHIGWLVAGICALLAFLVICWVVFNHLLSYASPAVQRPMVRILIMVPVYAIDSWLSLVFKDYAQYFDLARDWHDPPHLHMHMLVIVFVQLVVALLLLFWFLVRGQRPGLMTAWCGGGGGLQLRGLRAVHVPESAGGFHGR